MNYAKDFMRYYRNVNNNTLKKKLPPIYYYTISINYLYTH